MQLTKTDVTLFHSEGSNTEHDYDDLYLYIKSCKNKNLSKYVELAGEYKDGHIVIRIYPKYLQVQYFYSVHNVTYTFSNDGSSRKIKMGREEFITPLKIVFADEPYYSHDYFACIDYEEELAPEEHTQNNCETENKLSEINRLINMFIPSAKKSKWEETISQSIKDSYKPKSQGRFIIRFPRHLIE